MFEFLDLIKKELCSMKDQLSDKIMKFVALTVKRQQKTPTMHIKKPKA